MCGKRLYIYVGKFNSIQFSLGARGGEPGWYYPYPPLSTLAPPYHHPT